MTPEQAAWVRKHAWPAPRRAAYANDIRDVTNCACHGGAPSRQCTTGQHAECPTTGRPLWEALLCDRNGLDPLYLRNTDHTRVAFVWLAGRPCRWICPCRCHQPANEQGLLFDLTTT